jgi:Iap family predicted aminopeptidase
MLRRGDRGLPAILDGVRKALLLLALGVSPLAACDGGNEATRQDAPTSRPAASEETQAAVSSRGLAEHLRALQRSADRHGHNRAAGTGGHRSSVRYATARLREAGWRVRLQPVPFPFFRQGSARLAADGRRLRPGRHFRVMTHSGGGRVSARVRDAGLGCERDDYGAVDPGGVALVRRGECFFRVKALNAQRSGVAGLLVADPALRGGPFRATLGGPGVRIPVVILGAEGARIARPGTQVRLAVDAVSEQRVSQNVIADSRAGSGDRVVMAGGHLDSVRAGPGINDNGSGVAALLEVAEAVGPRPPGAHLRLAFWAAEELGLYGSRRYVRSLSAGERDRIVAYVNLDMVGSRRAVREVYDGAPPIERALRRALTRPAGEADMGGSSDHAPFQRAGIPVGGLYTGSAERAPGGKPRDPCYHRRCDTIDNVNRGVLLEMARAAAEALRDLSRRAR